MSNNGRIPLQSTPVKKRSPDKMSFWRRKCKSGSHLLKRRAHEVRKLIFSPGKSISQIDPLNGSTPQSGISRGVSSPGRRLEHAPSLRILRPLMNAAHFSRRRNTLSKRSSKLLSAGAQKSADVKKNYRRSLVLDFDEPQETLDDDDFNRTTPVIPEVIGLTIDESKKAWRCSQELLARRQILDPHGTELGTCTRIKLEGIETRNGSPVAEEREQTGESETCPGKLQVASPSVALREEGGSVFSDLLNKIGPAIDFLWKETGWNLKKVVDLKQSEFEKNIMVSVKTEIEAASIVLDKLVEIRKMIKLRTEAVSSLPKVEQNSRPASTPIRTNPTYKSPPGRYSLNQDHGTPGKSKLQSLRRLCSPTASVGERFSENSSPNRDNRSGNTLRTIKSAAREILDNLMIPNHMSLDVIPVGVRNTNRGTTCYINCALQLLSSVPEIFRRVEEGMELREEGKSEMEACVAYKKFMEDRRREMAKVDLKQRTSLSNCGVANVMFKLFPGRFVPKREEDCLEFITSFLQQLDQELGEDLGPGSLFKGSQWRFYTREDDGTEASRAPPPQQEHFVNVSLSLNDQHRQIEQAFQSYTTQQRASDGRSHHWCQFEELPALLLVHVLSFDDARPVPQKKLRRVHIKEVLQFEEEWMYQAPPTAEVPAPSDSSFGIIITKDLEEDRSTKPKITPLPKYRIRGVVFHEGILSTTGHYTAALYLPDGHRGREWFYCADEYVKPSSWKSINSHAKSSQVTILLYERDCS